MLTKLCNENFNFKDDPAVNSCKNLFRAIFNRALDDLKAEGREKSWKTYRRTANEWFLGGDNDEIVSFHDVCEHIDLDPNTVLKVLRERNLLISEAEDEKDNYIASAYISY